MKVNDWAGTANHTTALYWEYDPRVARRGNLDNKPNYSVSPYSSCANNPIWYSDRKGDTLTVGSNPQSLQDIKSLVKGHEDVIQKTPDGRIVIAGLSEVDKTNLLKSDAGFALVNDLINSPENYLYEASDLFLGNSDDGSKLYVFVDQQEHKVVNASNGGKDSKGIHEERPREGFDGQVTISPNATHFETDITGTTLVPKSRSSVVFHELGENYARTHNNLDYEAAHRQSVNREKKWKYKSGEPGASDAESPRMTRERYEEIQKIINVYMGIK